MRLIITDYPITGSFHDSESVMYIHLPSLKIAHCVGCFGCWTRTPGKCVIHDDAPQVYTAIAKCDTVLYISRVVYGSYDVPMKTMLERAIPVQQAFIRIHQNETHHIHRNPRLKKATILAYGDLSPEGQEIFRELVGRNAKNMNFESYDIIFTTADRLNETAQQIIGKWERS